MQSIYIMSTVTLLEDVFNDQCMIPLALFIPHGNHDFCNSTKSCPRFSSRLSSICATYEQPHYFYNMVGCLCIFFSLVHHEKIYF